LRSNVIFVAPTTTESAQGASHRDIFERGKGLRGKAYSLNDCRKRAGLQQSRLITP